MSSAKRNSIGRPKKGKAALADRRPSFLNDTSDLPTTYIVRATPSTNAAKSARQLRRIFLHQAVMRGLDLTIGELVVVRHETADPMDEGDGVGTAFGIAWPTNSIEVNAVQIHALLRQSHLIYEGDRVRLSKYTGPSRLAKDVMVCCIEENKPSYLEDSDWRTALHELLREIKFLTEGMDFECATSGRVCAFTIVSITHDELALAEAQELRDKLDVLSLDPLLARHSSGHVDRARSASRVELSSSTEDDSMPVLYVFEETTSVDIEHRPQSSGIHLTASRPSSVYNQHGVNLPATPTARKIDQTTENKQTSVPRIVTPSSTKSAARAKVSKETNSTTKDSFKSTSKLSDQPRFVEIDSEQEEQIIKEASMPRVSYDSIGGLSAQIASLREICELPLLKPHIFARFNMSPPRGVLLYGPPGTGKTMLLRAVASETSARVFTISGPSIISKYMGEAEEKLRKLWQEAEKAGPSIIFIDEVDAITPKREADSGEAESRIVASLLTLMDGMNAESKVVVIGATNRPNSIDPALRRPGRFDREIEIGIPDAKARLEILRILLDKIPNALSASFIDSIAAKTHGFVGADLSAVCRETVLITIKSGLKAGILEEYLIVEEAHMQEALPLVRPSAMREIFLETPKTRWSDIGGQEMVKQKLRESVEWPLTHPETFKRLGIIPAKGVLLYGPPGCSKTLTAKALATEAGLNFMAVKGPELFNKYIGEAERALREIFRKARAASPSIIFFDEIDALSGSRGGDGEGSGSSDRILTTLLNEIDGVEDLVNVTILAATNRPDVIDAALLRPGRLDRLLYVGPPDGPSRQKILQIQFSRMSVAKDVSITHLAEETEGCSGAEIAAFCRDAGLLAMQEDLDAAEIAGKHFESALSRLKRGITPAMIDFYESFAATYGSA